MANISFDFSGFIEEIGGISVDSFQEENFQRCSTFFLSHCHSDHTVNLFRGFQSNVPKNPHLKLYCTVVSSIILKNKFGNNEEGRALLSKVLSPLRVGNTYDLLIPIENLAPAKLTVTIISANHCAGSCMFLFKYEGKTVLYTGDFRFHVHEFERIKALHDNNGKVINLDNLYLDTTFLKQSTYHFPTRRRVLIYIFNEIDDYLSQAGGRPMIHIFRPSFLGSETIIRAVALKYNCKVHLEWNALKLYRGVFNVIRYITTNARDSLIHMCKLDENGTNPCFDQPGVLKIHPSALWYARSESWNWVQRTRNNQKIRIAQSTHCSRKEIEKFIEYFRPRKIKALVTPDGYSKEEIQETVQDKLNSL